MDILQWLARCAALFRWRKPRGPSDDRNLQRDRLLAARSLHARLPGHIRRDIGLDDG
jgi:hypothetical protein